MKKIVHIMGEFIKERIENGVEWLHLDCKDMDYKGKKIYLFKA